MKNKLLPIVSILAAACIILGFSWYFISGKPSKEKQQGLNADAILATMVNTEPITTNLKSDGYISLRFQIQTSNAKAKDELVKRSFQVRNIVLRLASSMTAKETQSPEGMADLENKMTKQINKFMQNGQVVKVFTTNKMIQ